MGWIPRMDLMNVRRWVQMGFVGVILAAAGCASHSKPAVTFEAPKPIVKPVEQTPAPVVAETAMPVVPPLPDALAQKTAEYARTVEPAVNARGAMPTGGTGAGTAAPSPVQWTDTTPHPRAAANTPAVLPVTPSAVSPGAASGAGMSATDAANLAAVTDSAGAKQLNDVPAIL